MKDVEEGYKRRDYRAKMAWKMKQYKRYDVKLVSIYPDNLKNLNWIIRKRLAEVTGRELPQKSRTRMNDGIIDRDSSQTRNVNREQSSPACPKCGSKMVVRRAKHGSNAGKSFWGCSQWPKTKCPGIINI